mgnify:CR=1 FL=1
MCTKILKKESSSRALAFVLLMFMMPLGFIGNTHSCGAMENDDEKKRLLGHANTSINGNAKDVEQGRGVLTSVVVQFDDQLLKELDSSDAVKAMEYVKTALSLGDNLDIEFGEAAKDIEAIKEIYLEEQKGGIKCDKGQTLGEVIIARGISGADVVQDYFVKNKERIAALIKVVKEHQIENNRILSENKCLKTTRTILVVCIPVAFVVAGVGAWALTWYLGGK